MKYLKLIYRLEFLESPEWGKRPAFVFRSVLGMNLRNNTCVLRQQETCSDCLVKSSCVYSMFFETNVDKNLKSLEGRNKAAHPFVLEIDHLDDCICQLSITFIGRAVNYIPYINYALETAGKKGVGKNRASYEIVGIFTKDWNPFVPSLEFIQESSCIWPKESYQPIIQEFKVKMETPCRIKENGRYCAKVNLEMLLRNAERRMSVLNEVFGDSDSTPTISIDVPSDSSRQKWVEPNYYSGRQQTVMKLGGVVGEILVPPVSDYAVLAYLEAMELFHVGKNISFGLGKIKVLTDDRY